MFFQHSSRYRRLIVLCIVIVALAIPATAIGSRLSDADRSLGSSVPAQKLDDEQTVDGVSLTLESIALSGTGTMLDFRLALPESIAQSSQANVFAPMFPGEHLSFQNVTLLSSGLFIDADAHEAGATDQTFTFHLGNIIDPAQAVEVTFFQILLAEDDGTLLLEGPWEFLIQPDMLPLDRTIATVPVNQTVETSDVRFTVSDVESRESGLYLYYVAESLQPQPMIPVEHWVHLEFADGSVAQPLDVRTLDTTPSQELAANERVDMVAVFDPAQASDVAASVMFGPFLVRADAPPAIAIDAPLGEWQADAVRVAGERFEIVESFYDDEHDTLTITVANMEPLEESTVMLLAAHEGKVAISDEAGFEYPVIHASTGMRMDDDGNVGTGNSAFTISGPFPSDLDQLEIEIAHSSILLREMEAIEIVLP